MWRHDVWCASAARAWVGAGASEPLNSSCPHSDTSVRSRLTAAWTSPCGEAVHTSSTVRRVTERGASARCVAQQSSGGSSFGQTTLAFRGKASPQCRRLLMRRRLVGWTYRDESKMLSPWLAKASALQAWAHQVDTHTAPAHAADSLPPPGPDVNAVHHRRELVQHAGLDCG